MANDNFKVYQIVEVEDFTFDQSKEAFEVAVKDELFRSMEEARRTFSKEYDRRKEQEHKA